MKKKFLTILAIIFITASITSCSNTLDGFGKDFKKLSEFGAEQLKQ